MCYTLARVGTAGIKSDANSNAHLIGMLSIQSTDFKGKFILVYILEQLSGHT